MTPRSMIAIPLTVLFAASAVAQPVSEGGRKFTTELTGEAEVNAAGEPNKGDLDGTGSASLTVNVGQQRVCWDMTMAGIAPPTRSHIHKAPATTTGGIVVSFFETTETADLNACTTTPVSRELLRDILQNPQEYYVNVHNADFPAGALRGQLSK
jgi:hypothetical protein